MFWKPKSCAICANPLTYEFGILDTLGGSKVFNAKLTLYCRNHILEKIREAIGAFDKPFIYHKVTNNYNFRQLAYLTINTLAASAFSRQDCDGVTELLNKVKNAGGGEVIVLENDVIKDAHMAPLFKISNPEYSVISKDKFVSMLSDKLFQLETVNKKGYFYFFLPYSESGIYLWLET